MTDRAGMTLFALPFADRRLLNEPASASTLSTAALPRLDPSQALR